VLPLFLPLQPQPQPKAHTGNFAVHKAGPLEKVAHRSSGSPLVCCSYNERQRIHSQFILAPKYLDLLPSMADEDSFLHLSRPLGPAAVGAQPTTAPLRVVIQPQVSNCAIRHCIRLTISGSLLDPRPLYSPTARPTKSHWHPSRNSIGCRRIPSRCTLFIRSQPHRDDRSGRSRYGISKSHASITSTSKS